jgi:hypothetical protein
MVESHDELIMEFIDMYGYNHSDEDDDDGGDSAAPLLLRNSLHLCHMLPHLRRSSKRKSPWRWFPSKKPLWRMR